MVANPLTQSLPKSINIDRIISAGREALATSDPLI